MPLIFEIRCSNCEFVERGLTSAYAVVDLENSQEAICPHPGERLEARELTGYQWADLVRAGRVGYRYPLTCRSCGSTDYYRTPRHFTRGLFAGLIAGIAHNPSLKEVAAHSCRDLRSGYTSSISAPRKSSDGSVVSEGLKQDPIRTDDRDGGSEGDTGGWRDSSAFSSR